MYKHVVKHREINICRTLIHMGIPFQSDEMELRNYVVSLFKYTQQIYGVKSRRLCGHVGSQQHPAGLNPCFQLCKNRYVFPKFAVVVGQQTDARRNFLISLLLKYILFPSEVNIECPAIAVTSPSYIAQLHRLVTSHSYITQLHRIVTSHSYIAQLHRLVTSPSYIAQLHRLVTSPSYIAQLHRLVTSPSYIAQLHRLVTSSPSYITQLHHIVTSHSYITQLHRLVTSPSYIAQLHRLVTLEDTICQRHGILIQSTSPRSTE